MYHARKYRVDTIAPEDVKFAIFRAVEGNMRNRIIHLQPGTVGFNSYTAAEYLEEMLGRFMKTRTKGGAKEEFEQKKQGADEDTLKYYDQNMFMMRVRETYKSLKD